MDWRCENCDEPLENCTCDLNEEVIVKISKKDLKAVLHFIEMIDNEWGPFPVHDGYYRIREMIRQYLS